MNKKQTLVLWIGVVLVGLLLIFPPWKFTLDIPYRLHLDKPGPYSLILNPPEVPGTSSNNGGQRFNGYGRNLWVVRLDTNRMLVPVALIAIVTGALFVTLHSKVNKSTE